jgi:hypothetical protein
MAKNQKMAFASTRGGCFDAIFDEKRLIFKKKMGSKAIKSSGRCYHLYYLF